jgi:hypothetical protein
MRQMRVLTYIFAFPLVGIWVWFGGWQVGAMFCGIMAAFVLIFNLTPLFDEYSFNEEWQGGRWRADAKWRVPFRLSISLTVFGIGGLYGYGVVLAIYGAAHAYPKLFSYPDHYGLPHDGSLRRLLALGICYAGGTVICMSLVGIRALLAWRRGYGNGGVPPEAKPITYL